MCTDPVATATVAAVAAIVPPLRISVRPSSLASGMTPPGRASSPIDVLKQVASTGYLRKRAPQELVVFQGGVVDPVATLETLVPETRSGGTTVAAVASTTAVTTGTVSMDARTKAKMQGYEGEACGECGNYTLVRNGTCMKCNTCGATSGCS
jgi:ribonucleoside-diphosphate reductase alpha chain